MDSTNPSCARCGSHKIIRDATLEDQGHHSDGQLRVGADRKPAAWLFKWRVARPLRATICGECGFTELYVDDPQSMYAALTGSQEPVGGIECLRCGDVIPSESVACVKCGWRYEAAEDTDAG